MAGACQTYRDFSNHELILFPKVFQYESRELGAVRDVGFCKFGVEVKEKFTKLRAVNYIQ
jgi:hypothetical protein